MPRVSNSSIWAFSVHHASNLSCVARVVRQVSISTFYALLMRHASLLALVLALALALALELVLVLVMELALRLTLALAQVQIIRM
jgi:hypothetical protein